MKIRNNINAVDMTRKIRDARRLAGKSHAERIAFYRERLKKLERKLPALLAELAKAEGGSGDDSKGHHKWLEDQDIDTVLKRIRERRGASKKKK